MVVLRTERFDAFRRGDPVDPGPGGALATRDHAARASLETGDWIVVVDNTAVPPTGAPSTGRVSVDALVLAPAGALLATAAWYVVATDDAGRRVVAWARDRLSRLGKTIN